MYIPLTLQSCIVNRLSGLIVTSSFKYNPVYAFSILTSSPNEREPPEKISIPLQV